MELALNTIALEPNRWGKDKSHTRGLEELFPLVTRAGYKACEIWQHHLTNRCQDDDPELAAEARRNGLHVAAIGAYPILHLQDAERGAEMSRLVRLLDAADLFGAEIVKVFCGRTASENLSADDRSRSIAFLNELLDRGRDHGVLITAETHANTLADSADACLALIADLDSDRFKLCFQPFAMLDTAQTLAEFDRLKAHVAHIHLQARGEDGFCLMKDSPLDHRALLRAIRESGFDGLLSVEFVKDCRPMEGEPFSDDTVVANAATDRAFVLENWSA